MSNASAQPIKVFPTQLALTQFVRPLPVMRVLPDAVDVRVTAAPKQSLVEQRLVQSAATRVIITL